MTRKPDDWFPLYIGDYQADTSHLSRDQHGAYLLLLMAYWRRGGPLQADDARLAAIVKATAAEWRKLRPVMLDFFVEANGVWSQKRADHELQRAHSKTEARSEAGRKGAASKWQAGSKSDGKRMAMPSNRHRQNDGDNYQEPQDVSSLRSETKKALALPELPEWLPRKTWDAYAEMRAAKRAPLTDGAKKLILGKLSKLRDAGHDPIAILEESTMRCWTGVFEPKPEGNLNGTGRSERASPHDKFLAGGLAALKELTGREID